MNTRIGILGLGYLGQEIADRYEWPKDSWGSYQNLPAAPQEPEGNVMRIHFDWELRNTWYNIPSGDARLVLTIPPVSENPEKEIARLEAWGAWMHLHRASLTDLVYISSTGVYPNDAGDWDELSPVAPDTPKGRVRYVSETVLARFFRLRIVRAGAIYGPGRHIGKRIRLRKPIPQGDQPVHRIHVSDLAQVVGLAVTEAEFPPVLNAVDKKAAPTEQVAEWMVRQLFFSRYTTDKIMYRNGIFTRKTSSPNRNRRISNSRLLALPGFSYRYPSYREGIRQAVLADLSNS